MDYTLQMWEASSDIGTCDSTLFCDCECSFLGNGKKISANHNMWYHFFHRQIVINSMVPLILTDLDMKKSTFKVLWVYDVTSHKIGPWDFFKFGQNRKPSTYGVQKNKNRPWYIFLILKWFQPQCVMCQMFKKTDKLAKIKWYN